MTSYPNDATYFVDWTGNSSMSYSEFLQAKKFEHSIRYAIDDQTKRLVANDSQLAERGISALSDKLEEGFSALSQEIGSVKDAIEEGTNAIVGELRWGFSEVLISLGRLNDTLSQLVQIARTPSQTWAYEQFEVARDEFRRGLYSESLASVERAIGGHGSNIGYQTEFRFHQLLGTIRLGSWLGAHANNSPEIVNPAKAESAFLAAARYAEVDYPLETGWALVCAGRAAYVQRRYKEAITYTSRALEFSPADLGAEFQLSRIYAVQGEPELAMDHLLKAIMGRADLAIRAACAAEFLVLGAQLHRTIALASEQYQRRYTNMLQAYDASLQRANDFTYFQQKLGALLPARIEACRGALDKAKQTALPGNLIAASDAVARILGTKPTFDTLFEDYKREFVRS